MIHIHVIRLHVVENRSWEIEEAGNYYLEKFGVGNVLFMIKKILNEVGNIMGSTVQLYRFWLPVRTYNFQTSWFYQVHFPTSDNRNFVCPIPWEYPPISVEALLVPIALSHLIVYLQLSN